LVLKSRKLNVNQFPENYHLIAIHSDLDEYRLAFFLNKKLNINLKRKRDDIYFTDQNASYSSYEFLDKVKFLKWIFFSNKSLVLENSMDQNINLFNNENLVKNEIVLLSNHKFVDYFLIIENIADRTYVKKILKKISEIRGIITSFITENKLDNKENLIFS
tara:strand:+ start:1270 stop:1752 length:483 start_codon:yes stop_codon:yes gene_type:complete